MPFKQGTELIGKRRRDRIDEVIAGLKTTHIDPVGGRKQLSAIERHLVDNKIYRYRLHSLCTDDRYELHRHAISVLIISLYRHGSVIFKEDEISEVLLSQISQSGKGGINAVTRR